MWTAQLPAAVLIAVTCLVIPARPAAQTPATDEAVWQAFMVWFKAAPPSRENPFAAYGETLETAGVAADEVTRRVGVLMAGMRDRSDWIEVFYDKVYATPLTGDPVTDRFTTVPSDLVVETARGLKPGAALDAGMGQGRNAVYLAAQGWRVTGFDLSGEAVRGARANASNAGVSIDAIKSGYDDFDFGTARWDLIVLVFAWAPLDDPAFVERLRAALRPGGRIVFEHFVDDADSMRPSAMHVLKPGQLRGLLAAFRIDRYEEVTDLADWGGPDTRLVRAVAQKR